MKQVILTSSKLVSSSASSKYSTFRHRPRTSFSRITSRKTGKPLAAIVSPICVNSSRNIGLSTYKTSKGKNDMSISRSFAADVIQRVSSNKRGVKLFIRSPQRLEKNLSVSDKITEAEHLDIRVITFLYRPSQLKQR